jgi:hypothetical protein
MRTRDRAPQLVSLRFINKVTMVMDFARGLTPARFVQRIEERRAKTQVSRSGWTLRRGQPIIHCVTWFQVRGEAGREVCPRWRAAIARRVTSRKRSTLNVIRFTLLRFAVHVVVSNTKLRARKACRNCAPAAGVPNRH